ncbi:hypothetical protein Cgig2_010965 [Carnegiea gigantea]|uniref:Uncharacterized protein n=1 Tax=Carnegiea gigantea TaxID=171969 RepID=A0A9Q1GNW7_9CARY|nr:hypothetical protein Cgig2_010965 [Carnegiea gigantea]
MATLASSRLESSALEGISKKASKPPRRLINIPASGGRWHGKWTCEYIFSLKDLQLDDLDEDGYKFQRLRGTQLGCRPKSGCLVLDCSSTHTGFGLSVDGRVITSISRKCSNCFSPFCRKIDTSICAWVLPDRRDDPSTGMPEIGGDDPSIIYVKPGYEANLDSLIQDTIRLQTAVEETCSELCEKSEPKLHYIGDQSTASLEKRWSSLLQLRNAIQ